MLYFDVLMRNPIGNLHPESNQNLSAAAGEPVERRAQISRTETGHAPLTRRSVVCLPAVVGGGGYPQQKSASSELSFNFPRTASPQGKYLGTRVEIFFA